MATLAIARSLGEKGLEVHCGEDFRHNLTSYSKYVTKNEIYPSPKSQPDLFLKKIIDIAKREEYEMIIPVRDDTTKILSKHREQLSKYTKLFLPQYQLVEKFGDKGQTIKIAQKHNVPVPKTYFPEDMDIQKIKDVVEYPLLIRPRVSSGARGICYVDSAENFDNAYENVKREYGEPIIQEYVSHEGGHYSIGALFDESSEPVAVHVYKETKQYPINGGPAVNAISVTIDKWVNGMLEMLKKEGWKGPVHMDVLYDPSSSTPKLLEVNPRFWMSLNLSIKSGVNFPYLLYRLGMGEKIEPQGSYKVGVKYRWTFPNEILWLTQTPDKIRGLKEIINFNEKDVYDGVLSSKDLLPALGIIMQSLNYFLDSEKRKLIFKRGWTPEKVQT